MHRTIYFILGGLLLIACAACGARDGKTPAGAAANTSSNAAGTTSNQDSTAAEVKTPPSDIVRVDVSSAEIAAGGAGEALVRMHIADGYHINANPATLSYQIATQLSVEPGDGVTAGKPVYPASITRKFTFEPQPFAVYEGEVVIKLPLRAETGAVSGPRSLSAKLRVQPCDDQACYPPRNINASIPITIK